MFFIWLISMVIFIKNIAICESEIIKTPINLLRAKRTLNEEKYTDSEINVSGASHIYVCSSNEKCQKIVEFSVSEHSIPNCFENYLPVSYELLGDEGKKRKLSGFLPHNGYQIQDDQKVSDICRKIKRFNVNEKKMLIMVGEKIALIDKKKMKSFIEWELLKEFEFFSWILYKSNLYDEENDTINYSKAFKDLIMVFVVIKGIFYFYHRFSCFLQCFSLILEENSRKIKLESDKLTLSNKKSK